MLPTDRPAAFGALIDEADGVFETDRGEADVPDSAVVGRLGQTSGACAPVPNGHHFASDRVTKKVHPPPTGWPVAHVGKGLLVYTAYRRE